MSSAVGEGMCPGECALLVAVWNGNTMSAT